ncbi:MAG TPA: DHA2 family efflux MFS transporter permease subunit [Steroidobacteraceae bacterium]|jgi:DHA2 family multidrug resistance protein|nr:DHA2 family efflux MFS transporter permease subunit [Steroidobacteraceae bacterium]
MSVAAPALGTDWKPRFNPWLIAIPVMLATFMVILDTSIVVVALPYIAGNLGATQDESTWVLTSYLVANAVILPASSWLSSFFGRKNFLIVCTIVFTVASATCGVAVSMPMLVIARVLQGIGGGAMQPLSQAILLESFPPTQRGTATALFGLGVVVAPIIGPTLGGWLTDAHSWRWTFYINLPVGIIAAILMLIMIEDPPYIRAARPRRVDAAGFAFMGLFLATLQVVLDKGQDADWFSAVWLRWVAVISALSLIAFIVRELLIDQPIVDLRVFSNRNFAVSGVLFGFFGLSIYALITLQPLFLQSLLGYPAFDAGLSVTPRGIGALAALLLVGALLPRVNPKLLVGIGFGLTALASFLLSRLNLQISMSSVVIANIFSGLGTSFIFVPLTTLAIGTLRNEQIGNATGIQNLLRNVGGSIGLSYVSTMLQRYAQVHQAYMVGHLSQLSPQYQAQLALLQRAFERGFTAPDAFLKARGMLYNLLLRQSTYWAFVDLFFIVGVLSAICIVLIPIFRKPVATHQVSLAE